MLSARKSGRLLPVCGNSCLFSEDNSKLVEGANLLGLSVMGGMKVGDTRVSNTVRYAEIDGLFVILDLNTEDYFVLDEVASEMWKNLISGKLGKGIYDAKDMNKFLTNCVSLGFICDISHREKDSRNVRLKNRMGVPSNFLTIRAWFSMVSTYSVLKMCGFKVAYMACEDVDRVKVRMENSNLMSSAIAAFLNAENFFWSRPDDCLQRSLAMFRFLRSLGLPVSHKIGGRRLPGFLMHAWVDHDGIPILDNPTFVKDQHILATLPYGE